MILDVVQLLGLLVLVAGVWVAAPTGVALILTGLLVIAAALAAERARDA